jgi:hypothetical protein
MTDAAPPAGLRAKKRYRLPGIEREGIAQLSLLETALWPLQGGPRKSPRFDTSYAFTSQGSPQTAHVTVRSALGLQPIDEFVLYGLLGATLSRPDPQPTLLATPYWLLKRLGLATGGHQYNELRDSLLRLSTTSYQNTAFYNPLSQEREWVSFQFLSMLLPTVGGTGVNVDNNRCWRIEWNPAFFRFCKATAGNLLFDLDLYRDLTPAARRLFLKLKDRFWRSDRVFLNVDDLTINGLGFSAERPLFKRKYDLTHCAQELLDHRIISLGRGQTAIKELFLKRAKGVYVIVFYEGDYFRQPAATGRLGKTIKDDSLYEPLKKIGLDDAGIRRLFHEHSRAAIERWLRITDAALHEKPHGFSGFKVSPAAFLVDGVQHNRLPPDWMYAHDKRRAQLQWEKDHAAFQAAEQALRQQYEQDRNTALEAFLRSPEGKAAYGQTLPLFTEFYRRTEPERFRDAAHEATVARIEQHTFQFPEYAVWAMSHREHQPSA